MKQYYMIAALMASMSGVQAKVEVQQTVFPNPDLPQNPENMRKMLRDFMEMARQQEAILGKKKAIESFDSTYYACRKSMGNEVKVKQGIVSRKNSDTALMSLVVLLQSL